jgi:hypothetical protein
VQATECVNVTIHNADEAKEIGKNCEIITGGLTFDSSLNETVTLDGVTTIQGDLGHNGCLPRYDHGCLPAQYSFNLSSSTLTYINGSLNFWSFKGLEEIAFPELKQVEQSFILKRMNSLKRIDITNLAYLGGLIIEAPNCTRIDHEGLRNFTEGYP